MRNLQPLFQEDTGATGGTPLTPSAGEVALQAQITKLQTEKEGILNELIVKRQEANEGKEAIQHLSNLDARAREVQADPTIESMAAFMGIPEASVRAKLPPEHQGIGKTESLGDVEIDGNPQLTNFMGQVQKQLQSANDKAEAADLRAQRAEQSIATQTRAMETQDRKTKILTAMDKQIGKEPKHIQDFAYPYMVVQSSAYGPEKAAEMTLNAIAQIRKDAKQEQITSTEKVNENIEPTLQSSQPGTPGVTPGQPTPQPKNFGQLEQQLFAEAGLRVKAELEAAEQGG